MRGISPLIAVIMLIAFALVVSGIFYSWVFHFAQSQREELQACSKAEIGVQNAYYDPDTGNINLVVYNTGDIPLKGFVVIVSPAEGEQPEVIRDFLEKELELGGTGVFPLEYQEDIETIMIQSAECKNAQDTIKIHDVRGVS